MLSLKCFGFEKEMDSPRKNDPNQHLKLGDRPEGFAASTDCILVVEGVELRVHSQILSLRSSIFAELFGFTEEKNLKLSECLQDVPLKAMQQLLNYMYASNPLETIQAFDVTQIEAVAPLADRFDISDFLEDADKLLHARVKLVESPYAMSEASMDFLVLAETCRLPRLRAKCEAFLAINFNRLKMHPQMQHMSGEAWARVMYASHHCGKDDMETMLNIWANTAGPPFSSAPQTPPGWDFRETDPDEIDPDEIDPDE